MTEHRFCGPEDQTLLAEAWRSCGRERAHVAGLDPECSIVATENGGAVGGILAARRGDEACVLDLAVASGDGRSARAISLLTALRERLAPAARLFAEIGADDEEVLAAFEACGFARDVELADWTLDASAYRPGASGAPPDDSFLVAIALEDVLADPVLGGIQARCWERAQAALVAQPAGIEGMALAALNSIAALVLHRKLPNGAGTEILALRALDEEDGEAAAGCLLDSMLRRAPRPVRFRAAHATEIEPAWLTRWGFRVERRIVRLTARDGEATDSRASAPA